MLRFLTGLFRSSEAAAPPAPAPAAAGQPLRLPSPPPLDFVTGRLGELGAVLPMVRQVQIGADGGSRVALRLQLNGRASGGKVNSIALGWGGCVVFYAIVREGRWAFVSEGEFEKTGLTVAQWHALAKHNLHHKLDQRRRGLHLLPGPHCQQLKVDGNLEASLLLIDSLWDKQLRGLAPNGVVAAVPKRDVCLFCDRHSEAGLAALRAELARHPSPSNAVSGRLIERVGGHWRVQR